MERGLFEIHREVVGEVPIFWSESPLVYGGGLVFRVGRADETLRTAGLTHLVEHLAFSADASGSLEFNGTVDGTTTHLWATGRRQEVLDFLGATAATLADLPLDRLQRERGILLTEAGSRSAGHVTLAASLRYGPVGHGLIGYDELGLHWVDREQVAAWAAERFTVSNVAAYLSGPPPEDFALALPRGSRIAAPDPDPIDYVEYPAVYSYGFPGGVALAVECPRSEATTTAFRVAERRLRDRLRHRAGTTYEVDWWYERLTRETAHVVIWADALEANIDTTRSGLLTVLDDLAERGPTAEELDREIEVLHRRLQDPATLQWGLIQRAEWELVGGEFETDEDYLDQQRAVPADAVRGVLASAMESMLLTIPQEGTAPAGRFRPYPSRSPYVIQGKRHRPPGLRSRFRRQDEWLVASDEGVAFETAELHRTVRYSDAIAVQCWSDGSRALWSRDGFFVFVDPSAWADGQEIVRVIDAQVTSGVTIDMEAGPDALDDPDLRAGLAAFEENDTERARALLERGLERAPANALGWALLSWCHQRAHRWGDAVHAAERACELEPTLETAQRARSYAYWWTGRSEEAVAAARATLELEPSDCDSIADFAWFLADAGEDVEAERAAQRAVELFPYEGSAWFAAGWAAMLRRDDAAAEEALRRAVELEPANSMWHNNLGWLLLQQGSHRDAAECFERALKRDPSNTFARANLTTALRFLGKHRAADKRRLAMLEENLARAEEMLARNPRDFEAHELLIATLRSLWRLEDAVAAARRAEDLDPDRPDTLHALAWSLMATGDLDAAAEPLERARRVDPNGDDTLYYVACLAASSGDAETARETADRAYELRPHTWGSWEAKGYAAFASGELDEAEQWFGRALHRLPLRCCSNTWSGLIHAERGDVQQARTRLAAANAVNPNCPCPARRRLTDRLATPR